MSNLDIVKQDKAFFGPRINMDDIFRMSKVVVSHQTLNSLNYIYLEALYLDIPLVHNSEDIKDAGYYYPGYDLTVGASQLKDALKFHDDNLDIYRLKAEKVFDRYSPNNEYVRQQYSKLFT